MSPAITVSVATLVVPENVNNFVSLPSSTLLLFKSNDLTVSFTLAIPCTTRPIRQRPRKVSEWSNVDNIAKGLLRSTSGSFT